jgi:hypothetical protein
MEANSCFTHVLIPESHGCCKNTVTFRSVSYLLLEMRKYVECEKFQGKTIFIDIRINVFSCKLRCISIKIYEKHNIYFSGIYCRNVSVEI